MATMNPFDLLGDDDTEDPSLLIAAQQQKMAVASSAVPKKVQSQTQAKQAFQSQPQAKLLPNLPSKPLPPAQAVRESRNEFGRGGGRGSGDGRGFSRGRGGYNRDYNTRVPTGDVPEDGHNGKPPERRDYGEPRTGYHGGRRGDFNNDVGDERPRRRYESHSGTGRGNEFKREGAGRGNWGTQADELAQVTEEIVNNGEKNLSDDHGEEEAGEGSKENPVSDPKEQEPEDKEMTLEEYEKVLKEKRKALQGLKTEERKVDTKVFESMQQLSSKKGGDDVFIKLVSDKDKRREAFEKEEKAKKSVSINEFLKPGEGEKYYHGRGRGRGGHGSRGATSNVPSIQDPAHFPTLGAN